MITVHTSHQEKFENIFTGYSKAFGQYTVKGLNKAKGKLEGKARTLDRAPTPEDYAAHLAGKRRMGIVPLMDDDKSVRFAAIDVDKYYETEEEKQAFIDSLVEKLVNTPLLVTRSKSGGAHIWLFSKEPLPALKVFRAMKDLAGELGFGKAEIFPKQTKRTGPDDTGNWINIPYFGDICQCRVMTQDGDFTYINLEEFLKFVESFDQSWLDEWLASLDRIETKKTKSGEAQDGRNVHLTSLAGALYNTRDDWTVGEFTAALVDTERREIEAGNPVWKAEGPLKPAAIRAMAQQAVRKWERHEGLRPVDEHFAELANAYPIALLSGNDPKMMRADGEYISEKVFRRAEGGRVGINTNGAFVKDVCA